MEKIAIVGSGNFGANAAFYLAENNLANVVLIDNKEGLAKGKALDMMEAAPVRGFGVNVAGSDSLADLDGAAVVVIAAGVSRKPEMSDADLLAENLAVMGPILAEVKSRAPQAILVIQREPVPALVFKAVKEFGFAPAKVIGLTGVLESARFCYYVARELGVSALDASAMVLGGRGANAIPLTQYANVSGVPITELMSDAQIAKVTAETQQTEEEILKQLRCMPAYYTPAATLAELVSAIMRSNKRFLPVTVLAQGQYGLNDVVVTLPALIGPQGVEKLLELELTASQQSALAAAAQA